MHSVLRGKDAKLSGVVRKVFPEAGPGGQRTACRKGSYKGLRAWGDGTGHLLFLLEADSAFASPCAAVRASEDICLCSTCFLLPVRFSLYEHISFDWVGF